MLVKKRGLFWYTDGSKTNEGTEAGMYSCGMRQRFSFSLWQYHSIPGRGMCAAENLKRGYWKRNIYMYSVL
jgi:hypothetical protein